MRRQEGHVDGAAYDRKMATATPVWRMAMK